MKRNIAVVGVGYWGKNLVRGFYELGVLSTICDSNKELGDKYKSQYRDVEFTDSYNNLLKDFSIKAVVIATPAVHHYRMAREALLSKKHVFVWKNHWLLMLSREKSWLLLLRRKGLFLW